MNTEELLKKYNDIKSRLQQCDLYDEYTKEFEELDNFVKPIIADRKLYQRRYEMIKNEYEHLKKMNNKEEE